MTFSLNTPVYHLNKIYKGFSLLQSLELSFVALTEIKFVLLPPYQIHNDRMTNDVDAKSLPCNDDLGNFIQNRFTLQLFAKLQQARFNETSQASLSMYSFRILDGVCCCLDGK